MKLLVVLLSVALLVQTAPLNQVSRQKYESPHGICSLLIKHQAATEKCFYERCDGTRRASITCDSYNDVDFQDFLRTLRFENIEDFRSKHANKKQN